MTPDDRKAVVRRYYTDVVNGGDYDALDEILHPAFVNHLANGDQRMPESAATIRAMFGRLRGGFPDLTFTIDDLLVDGDKVIDRGHATGTHLNEYAGHPPSGKSFLMREMHVYRVEDGRIIERWSLEDVRAMYSQLGLPLS